MIEAALWRYAGDVQLAAIERAVWMFENEWYLGDGIYGDGPDSTPTITTATSSTPCFWR
jgi:hypothetical protein